LLLRDERSKATPFLADLAAGERIFEEVSPAELDRLGGVSRVELLLAASYAQRYVSPPEMLRLAEIAVCEARLLSARRYGSLALADLRARSWAELGNAFRVADDLLAADQCLKQALRWARRGSSDAWLAARLADLTASLWADQGHYADAIESLERLAVLYKGLSDLHLAGRALISRGIFLGHDSQPRQAIASLSTGLTLIDPEREPGLQLSGMHELVGMLVDLGQYREARNLLWQVQHLHQREGSPLNLVRLRWLWGRVYSGLGDLDRAQKELEVARAGFGNAGKAYDQALVSLDLAEIYVRQGRRDEAQALAKQMLVTFRRLGIAREVIVVLVLTRQRCADPFVAAEEICRCFREVAVLVTELDRSLPRHRRLGG
jgi:tetratricopeptide (TPR) repeat protein